MVNVVMIGIEGVNRLLFLAFIISCIVVLIINLIYFTFFRRKSRFKSWSPVIITVGIASAVLELLTFDTLVKKIDEKLLVKRFWLIGKAYKKYLEMSK